MGPDILQHDPSDAVKYWIHQSKRKPNYIQDQDAPTVGSDLDEVLFDPDKEFDNILSENAVMEFIKDVDSTVPKTKMLFTTFSIF